MWRHSKKENGISGLCAEIIQMSGTNTKIDIYFLLFLYQIADSYISCRKATFIKH